MAHLELRVTYCARLSANGRRRCSDIMYSLFFFLIPYFHFTAYSLAFEWNFIRCFYLFTCSIASNFAYQLFLDRALQRACFASMINWNRNYYFHTYRNSSQIDIQSTPLLYFCFVEYLYHILKKIPIHFEKKHTNSMKKQANWPSHTKETKCIASRRLNFVSGKLNIVSGMLHVAPNQHFESTGRWKHCWVTLWSLTCWQTS